MDTENLNAFLPSIYGWHSAKIIELTVKSSKHAGLNILHVKVEIENGAKYTGAVPLVSSGPLLAKRNMLSQALGLDINAALPLYMGRALKVNVQPWHSNGRTGEGIEDYAGIGEDPNNSAEMTKEEVSF